LEAFAAASFPGATAAAVVAAEAAACAATVLSRPWEWTAGQPSSRHRKPSAMAQSVVPIGLHGAVMGRQSVGAEFRHIPVAAAAVVASEMETRIWNGQQRTTVVVVVDDLCLAKSWEVIIVKLYSFFFHIL